MQQKVFSTNNDWTGLIMRITTGFILFPHGAQKLFGWFGGYGFEGTMAFFTGKVHLPWIIGFLVIMIESIGTLLLVAGFAGRIWSALIVILMTGVMLTSHLDNGFFMNWFGNQKGEGYKYDLLLIGLSVATLINGSGRFSVDQAIANRSRSL